MEEVESNVSNAADTDGNPGNGKFQKLVDYCLEKFEEFKKSSYRESKLKEIKEARKVYEMKADDATFPWKDAANYIMPLTTIAIDNIEPRMVAGMVGTDPIAKFESEGKEPVEVQYLEEFFNSELKNVCDVKGYARGIVHTILIEGTHFSIPKYTTETRMIKDFLYDERGMMVLDEEMNPQIVEKETTIFEGGKFEVIPFSDIYCADDLGTMADWERAPVIRMVRPTYGELKKKDGKLGYMNIGKWLLTDKTDGKIQDGQQTAAQEIDGVSITGKEVIESIEVHLPYALPLDDDNEQNERQTFEEENLVVTIALKSKTVYRIVRQVDLNYNNEKLIKRIRLNPEEGRSFGTGLYGKLKSLQNGCSDLFNHMINVAVIIMIPYFFYSQKTGMKGDIVLEPGKGIPVDDVEGIKFPSFNINPAQYMKFVEFFISLWERTTSISDPQIGRLADRKETATAILTAVQEGGVKQNYQVEISKEEFISALATMFDLYYKNMPYNKVIEFEGQKAMFPRQAMRRPFKFRLTGSTEKANKLIDRKEAEDVLTMFGQDQIIDPMKIREDVLRTYGKENPKEYINPQAAQAYQIINTMPGAFQALMAYAQQVQAATGSQKKPAAPSNTPTQMRGGIEQGMAA
jgi:hypothetical protein